MPRKTSEEVLVSRLKINALESELESCKSANKVNEAIIAAREEIRNAESISNGVKFEILNSRLDAVDAALDLVDNDLAVLFDDVGFYIETDEGWDGSATVYEYDLSAYSVDTTKKSWSLREMDTFQDLGGEVSHSHSSVVRFEFSVPLDAGTYALIGR